MAKEKAGKKILNGELPESIASLIERSRENYTPGPDEADQAACPLLREILSPRLVDNPDYNGNGTPNKVLREPLLMISWDRALGTWRFNISDKVLNFGIGGSVPRLAGAVEAIEEAIQTQRVTHKTLKGR